MDDTLFEDDDLGEFLDKGDGVVSNEESKTKVETKTSSKSTSGSKSESKTPPTPASAPAPAPKPEPKTPSKSTPAPKPEQKTPTTQKSTLTPTPTPNPELKTTNESDGGKKFQTTHTTKEKTQDKNPTQIGYIDDEEDDEDDEDEETHSIIRKLGKELIPTAYGKIIAAADGKPSKIKSTKKPSSVVFSSSSAKKKLAELSASSRKPSSRPSKGKTFVWDEDMTPNKQREDAIAVGLTPQRSMMIHEGNSQREVTPGMFIKCPDPDAVPGTTVIALIYDMYKKKNGFVVRGRVYPEAKSAKGIPDLYLTKKNGNGTEPVLVTDRMIKIEHSDHARKMYPIYVNDYPGMENHDTAKYHILPSQRATHHTMPIDKKDLEKYGKRPSKWKQPRTITYEYLDPAKIGVGQNKSLRECLDDMYFTSIPPNARLPFEQGYRKNQPKSGSDSKKKKKSTTTTTTTTTTAAPAPAPVQTPPPPSRKRNADEMKSTAEKKERGDEQDEPQKERKKEKDGSGKGKDKHRHHHCRDEMSDEEDGKRQHHGKASSDTSDGVSDDGEDTSVQRNRKANVFHEKYDWEEKWPKEKRRKTTESDSPRSGKENNDGDADDQEMTDISDLIVDTARKAHRVLVNRIESNSKSDMVACAWLNAFVSLCDTNPLPIHVKSHQEKGKHSHEKHK